MWLQDFDLGECSAFRSSVDIADAVTEAYSDNKNVIGRMLIVSLNT